MARLISARFRFGFAFGFGLVMVAAGLSSAEIRAEDSHRTLAAPSTLVTRQEVWQAVAVELRRRGISEEQLPRVEDLDLPVALPALAGRQLRVSSACWDAGPQRTQFRLECGAPGQCLPFLAYVHGDARGDGNDDNDANGGATGVSRVQPSGTLGSPLAANGTMDAVRRPGPCRVASASGPRPAPEAVLKPDVRPGDRARAVFLANGLRMTASVTCLDRGREGEVIRVRAPDGHVFRARISGPALLEALPQ